MTHTSQTSLKRLTDVVRRSTGNEGSCPPDKYPDFRQLDNLISTTAWGTEAREDFFERWAIVEKATDKRFEVGSFAELVHLVCQRQLGSLPFSPT